MSACTRQTTSKVRLAFVLNDAPSLHRNDAAVHDRQGTVLRAAPPPASQHHTQNRCLMRRSAAARSAKPVYRHTATMSTTRRRQNAHLCVAHDTHSATSRLRRWRTFRREKTAAPGRAVASKASV